MSSTKLYISQPRTCWTHVRYFSDKRLRPFLIILPLLIAGCNRVKRQPTNQLEVKRQEAIREIPHLSLMQISTHTGQHQLQIETVSTDADRQRGLMHRNHLPENQGMLFIFQKEERHPFWMKNTLIPLDMIHLSKDKRVVGIVYNAKPLDLNQVSIDKPSTYVLEVNAGVADRLGINAGDIAQF